MKYTFYHCLYSLKHPHYQKMCLFWDVTQIMMKEVFKFIPSDLYALILFSVPPNFIYDNEALTYQTALKQDQRSQRSPGLEVHNSQSTCCCADWL